MEIKELLIRVWKKMNCKEMLVKYEVSATCEDWTANKIYTIAYSTPRPTEAHPDGIKFNMIRFVCTEDKGVGFSADTYSSKVAYPCTENEAIEIKYVFHQIRNKLEEIRCEELLELL